MRPRCAKNLRKVTLPNGVVIEYLIDGQNRRVGRKVDGVITHRWLYADQLRIIAELDGAGVLTKRFVYGTRSNLPDYMIAGGITYRIIADHLGSPRMVIDLATGTVVQAVRFDEYGYTLSDTNPGFIPFGFAGGLHDVATGLVRFGARDYDAYTGRWTTKDPILFAGGDTNLYGYVFNDPVTSNDPSGLAGEAASEAATAAGVMWSYYQKMRDVNFIGADKYYHCLAHCTATRLGVIGSLTSGLASVGREWIDFPWNMIKDPPGPRGPMDPFESWADCSADTFANETGRNVPPNQTCDQGCGRFRPPGFPY